MKTETSYIGVLQIIYRTGRKIIRYIKLSAMVVENIETIMDSCIILKKCFDSIFQ